MNDLTRLLWQYIIASCTPVRLHADLARFSLLGYSIYMGKAETQTYPSRSRLF